MKIANQIIVFFLLFCLFACAPMQQQDQLRIPAREYAQAVRATTPALARSNQKAQVAGFNSYQASAMNHTESGASVEERRARMHFVKDYPIDERQANRAVMQPDLQMNSQRGYGGGAGQGYDVYRPERAAVRGYTGPLSLGDPGVSASIWQESRNGNDLFRDHRAFQPMDLLTIVVTESSEGKKEADTEVKQESEILTAITGLFGLDAKLERKHGDLDGDSLIGATTQNDFKGEGETTRKGSLTARISAMVAEVLPSGILRIEGEKIISVNSEEQVMVISGLVRPRDINSANEVDSSKVANVRIDYFGRGTVGEAQRGGWFGRLVRTVWPF